MRYVPRTKKERLELVESQIQSKINTGYTLETYEGLRILTKDEDRHFSMCVYKDAAAHPIAYHYYRTIEQRNTAVENIKSSYDRNKAYKAEAKANPTKSTAANCASAIRAELAKVFPGIKFSVTSSIFSGGNSVRIGWNDGPLTDQVTEVTGKYQYGQFNGMEDIYEYTNSRDDIPQTKYVMESRNMSPETRAILEASAEEIFNEDTERFSRSGCSSSGNLAYRVFQKSALPAGAKVIGIKRNEESIGYGPESFYTIDFKAPEAPQTKTEPEFETVEVQPGTVQIIDYSARAIAVIGDTKPIKDKLKAMGGRFNFRLSCGAGWIFPKTRLEEVQRELTPKSEVKALPPAQTNSLRDEIVKTVEFFADTDKQIHGFVTDEVKEIARIQDVKLPDDHKLKIAKQTLNMPPAIAAVMGGPTIEEAKNTVRHYDNLEDLEQAVNDGQVIDLMNLHSLVNKKPEPLNALGQTAADARSNRKQLRLDKANNRYIKNFRRGTTSQRYL